MTVHPAFPTAAAEAAPLTVRVADPLALSDDLAAAWDRLADAASEPNPFAERWCLQSALHLLDPERHARLVIVRDGSAGQVIGVMPLASAAKYGRLPMRHVTGWTHPNQFHGAPLFRAGAGRADSHPLGGARLAVVHEHVPRAVGITRH